MVTLFLLSDDCIGLVFIFEMKLLYSHYKLTTERNRHSQGSGPLGSGPIGPGSGYSVMPSDISYCLLTPTNTLMQLRKISKSFLTASKICLTGQYATAPFLDNASFSIMISSAHNKI